MPPLMHFLIVLLFIVAGCSPGNKTTAVGKDTKLEEFADLMIGKYSSERQSIQDSNYFNISLTMNRIWQDRTDGIWLYVEQAQAAKMDKPYRQRVYRLSHPSENIYTSDVYTIKNPGDFVGLSKDTIKQNKLTYDKIEIKDGCSVILNYQQGEYTGGTDGAKCPSDLRGAKYATTRIVLKPGELYSWDQGFDAAGNQVWGATKGGYIFIKE